MIARQLAHQERNKKFAPHIIVRNSGSAKLVGFIRSMDRVGQIYRIIVARFWRPGNVGIPFPLVAVLKRKQHQGMDIAGDALASVLQSGRGGYFSLRISALRVCP